MHARFFIGLPKAEIARRDTLKREGLRFDLIGFLVVATFLAALEAVLNRGLDDD